MDEQTYGDLLRVGTDGGVEVEVLRRVPLRKDESAGGLSEASLQDLLFRYPRTLPIKAIDPSYAEAVPICTELVLPAGKADALYVNRSGRITLAEFKLWRNPQARREVIGQILDYAKDLASWGYEDLQRQVSLATGKSGNAVYDLVRERSPDLDEAEFVDNVTRHLRRGEFLLLIIGDGIREDAVRIVDFVQRHTGLHFNLALVEAALYRDADTRLIVQPRVLARTEIVQRIVVEGGIAVGEEVDEGRQKVRYDREEENLRFWRAVLKDYAFADPDVGLPDPSEGPTLYVPLPAFGRNGDALYFNGFLGHREHVLECFLTVRKNEIQAERFFAQLRGLLPDIQSEVRAELLPWERDGRPRIGFRLKDSRYFLAQEKDDEFRKAVAWMREHLNVLVSILHPRLQRMRADKR